MTSAIFTKRLQKCFSRFQSLSREIEERIELLNQKERDCEVRILKRKKQAFRNKIDTNFEQMSDQINLNIGGERISSSRSTLTSIKDTYFYVMLSSDRWRPNAEGNRRGKLIIRRVFHRQKSSTFSDDSGIHEDWKPSSQHFR